MIRGVSVQLHGGSHGILHSERTRQGDVETGKTRSAKLLATSAVHEAEPTLNNSNTMWYKCDGT